jgi:hypothetical protein
VKIRFSNGIVREQDIIYEQEPKFCNNCKVFGHTGVGCKYKNALEDESKGNSDKTNVEADSNAMAGHEADTNKEAITDDTAEEEKGKLNGSKATIDGDIAAQTLANTGKDELTCNNDVLHETEQTDGAPPVEEKSKRLANETDDNFTAVGKKKKTSKKKGSLLGANEGQTSKGTAANSYTNAKRNVADEKQKEATNTQAKKKGVPPPTSTS